jgi:hypothetical protein
MCGTWTETTIEWLTCQSRLLALEYGSKPSSYERTTDASISSLIRVHVEFFHLIVAYVAP